MYSKKWLKEYMPVKTGYSVSGKKSLLPTSFNSVSYDF